MIIKQEYVSPEAETIHLSMESRFLDSLEPINPPGPDNPWPNRRNVEPEVE